MANLIGNETWSNNKATSQVYQATHDGAGNSLPYMSKSFISFTFGGKAIEDFGLIVVNSSDRMERPAYASFSDLTSTYDTLDGQLYWGSKFEPNQLELVLATDEMTEQQVDNFREWFAPGNEKELILSEHPNRAIFARVASAPVLSFIPFEKQTTLKMNGQDYNTSTTLYRGEVSLSFIMDEPHWHGILSYMPTYVDKKTLEILEPDSNSINKVNSLNNKDMLKVMLEDGIPHQSVLIGNPENLTSEENFFLGNNLLVTRKALVSDVSDPNSTDTIHARVSGPGGTLTRLGVTVEESNGLNLNENLSQYLFYSGTAPSYPIVQFTLYPSFDNSTEYLIPGNDRTRWTARYIKAPKNSFVGDSYSYIKIDDKYFYFTTPSLLTSLNKALYYFKRIPEGTATSEVIDYLIEQIPNYYARAWAIACVKSLGVDVIIVSGANRHKEVLCNNMMALMTNNNFKINDELVIPNSTISNHVTETDSILIGPLLTQYNSHTTEYGNAMTFIFNSKTGEAIMKTKVRVATDNDIEKSELKEIVENVGDMVCSDYLTIENRNFLNSNGKIDLVNCKKISSDLELSNVLVFYRNMYL